MYVCVRVCVRACVRVGVGVGVCVCVVFCPEADPSLDMYDHGGTYLSFLGSTGQLFLTFESTLIINIIIMNCVG